MADYLVPVNLDIPRLEAHFVEEDDPHVNPLGVKGVAEIALVGMGSPQCGTWSRGRLRPFGVEPVWGAPGRSALSRKY
jgi:hypothetical protein